MKFKHLLVPLAVLFLAGNGCQETDLEIPGNGKVVTRLEISNVQAPVYRGTPVTAFTTEGQYSGEVAWTPAHRQFFANTEYKAKIILIANHGWTFTGVKENSFIVPGGTAAHEADSGTITVTFPKTGETDDLPITLLTIPDVQIPESGVLITTSPIDTEQYSGTVSWTPDTKRFLGDTEYTAQILLLDKPGWTLMGMEENSFVVPGATTALTDTVDPGKITAVFPRTVKTVSMYKISSVNVTVGAVPPTTIAETEQYTGTISWTPDDAVFKERTVYSATIQLTPKDDWTLTGVWEDFFSVYGAATTNVANSGLITAVFPKTPSTITLSAIPDIPVPLAGMAQPHPTISTSQYYAEIYWIPYADFFEVSTEYTAKITITPKEGWTLANIPENFFTVEGGTATNAASSNKVTAVFPATAGTITGTITLLDIPNITIPDHEVQRPATHYSTEQYEIDISWYPYIPGGALFKENTKYSAVITITPHYGWTIKGLPENAFRVAGATSTTYDVGSYYIHVYFPSTGE